MYYSKWSFCNPTELGSNRYQWAAAAGDGCIRLWWNACPAGSAQTPSAFAEHCVLSVLNVLLSEMYGEDVEDCTLHLSVVQWRTLGSSAFALRCTLSMLNVYCQACNVSKILSIVHCRAPNWLRYFALVCEEMTYPRFVRLLYFAY